MTKLYQKLVLAALAAVAFTLGAKAQNAFYTQTFAGGIPAGWTTTPTASAGGFNGWVWEDAAGAATNASTYRIAPIASTTASDGWMLFDSDRDCSGTQDAKLISPVVSCTGKSTVVIEFQEWYRKFSDSTALMVSSDGGATWTYFRIKENVCTNNQYCSPDATGHTSGVNPTTVQIDVSAVAANQANVKFGFRFVSNAGTGTGAGCAYQFKIDDVRVLDGLTTYASNYKVAFPLRPNSWMTPSSQLTPITWGQQALNLGTQARTNVSSTVKVTDVGASATTPLFTDTRSTPLGATTGTISLGAGGTATDTATIMHSATFTPPTTPTFYQFQYDLAADVPSLITTNPTYDDFFGVSDSLFLKTSWDPTNSEPNVFSATTTGSTTATQLEWGVFYDVTTGVGNLAKSVLYSLAKPTTAGAFANEPITATLYKWVDANSDNAIDFATELTAVGLGTETIEPAYVNFGIRELKLDDLASGNSGVALENNTKYFVSITAPTAVYIGYDNQINDNDYVGVVTQGLHPMDNAGTGTWFSGFSGGQLPVIGLNLTPVTGTKETKPTAYKVNVFPNPTTDLVNLTVNFENATSVTYEITDLTGKVFYSEFHRNATNDKFTYNTRALAAGVYNIVVRTEAGVQSSRFTVAK